MPFKAGKVKLFFHGHLLSQEDVTLYPGTVSSTSMMFIHTTEQNMLVTLLHSYITK